MGISKKINIIGQRFGNLVVIDEALSDPSGFAKWKCLCDCGNFRIARGTDLRAGIVTHCGCKNKENRIDKTSLVGRRFGRLLVLERDLSVPTGRGHEAKWICQCDCGNKVSVITSSLKRGKTKSCGCYKNEMTSLRSTLDLTGQRFYKLVALERTNEKSSHGSYIWKCQCDCGNIHYASAELLRSGKLHSCGCISNSYGEEKIEKILQENQIPYEKEYTFSDLKGKNNKRALRFDFGILDCNKNLIFLLEFDGEQHFNSNSAFYTEDLIKNDKIKNQYCKEHNIPLVRIPYWEIDNISLNMILGTKFLVK